MTADQFSARLATRPSMTVLSLAGAILGELCSSSAASVATSSSSALPNAFAMPSSLTAPDEVTVRMAVADDAEAACEVLRRSIIECCVPDHHNDPAILAAWLGNKTPENVAAWFASPLHFAVVALRGQTVVGVALLTRKGKVCLCHVVPQVRHTGCGRALLGALETQAVEWDIATLQVASTLVAQDFYRRNGYTALRPTESCYGLEATLFSKKLPASKRSACRCGGSA